jgi:hypothetical protein
MVRNAAGTSAGLDMRKCIAQKSGSRLTVASQQVSKLASGVDEGGGLAEERRYSKRSEQRDKRKPDKSVRKILVHKESS